MTSTLLLLLSLASPPGAQGPLDVDGRPLQACSVEPMTGYYRDGTCRTGPTDRGTHVVCAQVTDAFLQFSRARGNDLITPSPEHRFPGLKAGDRWCLCALRWREAQRAGVAPPVVLEATNGKVSKLVASQLLRQHAVKAETP